MTAGPSWRAAGWLLACALALPAASARAEEGCGKVRLQGGQVLLARPLPAPLPADWPSTPVGRRCLADIGKELGTDRLLRSVTVAYRMITDVRSEGVGLAAARTVADALIATGLPRSRVFAVAPLAHSREEVGLVVRYAERAPESVVARIGDLSGAVDVGPQEDSLRAAEPAMPLLADELVRTGGDGQAVVQLLDGSGVRLARSTLIKLAQLRLEESGDRAVRVEVLRGRIEAEVRRASAQSSFDASTRVAVASVRGTVFRLAAEPTGSARLETLDGSVRLGSATDPSAAARSVKAGYGARVQSTGAVGPLRQLPPAPLVVQPLQGELPAAAELSWSEAAGAARYLVELARDADFLLEAREYAVTGNALALAPRPASGKWFWRVTATSWDGFSGAPSKVYSFTIAP